MTSISHRPLRATISCFAVLGLFAITAGEASAVSMKVKIACKNDYYTHCSQHEPESPGVRKCMRAVGKRLSQGCKDALVEAGLAPRSKKRYAQR